MSFDIPIRVDPGDSAQKIKGVETALKQAEDKGKQAGQAMLATAKAFKSLGDAVKAEQSALERTRQIHDQLTRQASPLAQGFARVAEAMKREKDMLEAIRGPAHQAMQDIQSLTSLLSKGAISANEFNTRLHAIRPPSRFTPGGGGGASGFDAASALGGLPGGSLIAGAVGGGVGGAATAGVQMAIGAAGQVIQLADAYQGLQNRLKALTGSQEQAAQLFEKLHISANKTYSDVNTTTQSFITFNRALKGLGVSQDQTIAFTERLNEVIAMSGTDAAGANAAMLQLSQALSSGVLRGEEFNSVIEQAPALLDPIAKHLGVTVGQLRALANEGKITSKIIYDAFAEAGPSIDRAFGEAIPTVSQQFQVLKNDIAATVGELAKNAELGKVAASAIANLKTVMAAATEQAKLLSHSFGVLGETMSLGDLASGSGQGLKAISDFFSGKGDFGGFDPKTVGQEMTDAQTVINRTIAEGTGKLNEYSQAMVEQTLKTQLGAGAATAFHEAIQRATGKTDEWRAATDGVSSQIAGLTHNLSNAIVAVASWDGALDALLGKLDPWYDAHERQVSVLGDITTSLLHSGVSWDDLTKKIEKNAAAAKKAHDEYAKLGQALLGSESPSERAIREGAADRAAFRAGVEGDAQAEIDAENRAYQNAIDNRNAQMKADEEWRKAVLKYTDEAAEKRIKAEDEVRDRNAEAAQAAQEAWAGAAGSIAADLARAFAEGDISAEKLLKKAALLALQVSASQIGGTGGSFLSALAGGLGGFAGGGTYMVPHDTDRLALPRAAVGWDGMIGGSGSTDSKLFASWVTPGEYVHINTPQQEAEQRSGGSSGGGGGTRVIVNMQNDRRDLVQGFDSRDGERVFVKLDRKLRGRRR